MEERKPKEKTEDELWIHNWIDENIENLDKDFEITSDKYTYYVLYNKENPYPLYIDNNYCIHHIYNDISTDSIKETIQIIKDWESSNEVTVDVMLQKDKTMNCDLFCYRE